LKLLRASLYVNPAMDVGSDDNVFVDRRDFPEVCCRPKPHHLCFLGVQLKALQRAPVVHRRHTRSKPSSDVTKVTNVGRLAVLDALHVVSKQMVADTMLHENVSDILCVDEENLGMALCRV